MARLTEPHVKGLSHDNLEQYPVWTWDDAMEGHQPLSDAEPGSAEYGGALFIKAHFQTSGHFFNGYLIGGPTYYAFGLFVDNKSFVMNINLPGLIQKSLEEIYQLLDCAPFPLFPIHYESPVRFRGGQLIKGTLVLKETK